MTRRIVARLDAALELVETQGLTPDAICLTEPDRRELTRAATRYWRDYLGSTAIFHPTEYKGHHLQRGRRSLVRSKQGVDVRIPRQVPFERRESAE